MGTTVHPPQQSPLQREIRRAMGRSTVSAFARRVGVTRQALEQILSGSTVTVRGSTLAGLVRAGVRLSPRLLQSLAA